MADIHDKVQGQLSTVERLIDKIPGWSGYQQRQKRRQADKLLRETLADQLNAQRRRMDAAQRSLIRRGRLDLVGEMESAVTRLKTFSDRVLFASYGYAGLFDAVKIREAELKQLYDFDAALFEYVERLDTANDHLQAAISEGEGLEETIDVIQEIVQEANTTFDRRQRLVLETG